LSQFNKGDFFKSIEEKQSSEQITSVLYPNDNTEKGKELRLKQQYFLVSATIQVSHFVLDSNAEGSFPKIQRNWKTCDRFPHDGSYSAE
jgi:glucan phosphorylase